MRRQETEEQRQKRLAASAKGGRIGGPISGRQNAELKRGFFKLSPDEIKANGAEGGRRSTSVRYICLTSGLISIAPTLGSIQKAHGLPKLRAPLTPELYEELKDLDPEKALKIFKRKTKNS